MLQISPLDTVFFRDDRPFYKGAENYASGVFPPAPSVVYGAMRTAFFARYIPKGPEKGDPTEGFRLKGLYLQCDGEPCFPLPRDCVHIKEEKENRAILLRLKENDLISNYALPYLLTPPEVLEVIDIAGGLLSAPSLKDYLHLLSAEFYFDLLEDYVMAEPKIGIGRSRVTRTAEDAMLYQIEMKRLENLNFLADYSGLDLPREGLLKLGGEGKPAAFKKVEKIEVAPPRLEGNLFKLYLATPAVFSQGWLPGWLDEKTLVGNYQGLKLRLLTACLGRYEPIGGFNIGKKRPKPLRRAVPAGSVYYFELLEGDVSDIIAVFHNQNIIGTDLSPAVDSNKKEDYLQYAQQGFGLAYVGKVQL